MNRTRSGYQRKRVRATEDGVFFTDQEFEQNKVAIDRAFAEIALRAAPGEIQVIVIPSNGLGTGRAQLQARAPRTFAYLQSRLAELADSL